MNALNNNRMGSSLKNQSNSILQRLEKLKRQMKHSQQEEYNSNLQQQNQSINKQRNHNQNNHGNNRYISTNAENNASAIKNYRLNKYLPNQTQPNQNNEQFGTQEYESYRKSLQKKLNYLFQKQKQILRNESQIKLKSNEQRVTKTYSLHQTNLNKQPLRQKPVNNYQNNINIDKFSKLNCNPLNQFPNLNHFKLTNYQAQKQYVLISNDYQQDEQIDRMQRKIRMLEMKYLGNFTQAQQSLKSYNFKKQNNRNIDSINLDKRQNRSKSNKGNYKKDKTSQPKSNKKRNMSQKEISKRNNQTNNAQINKAKSDLSSQNYKISEKETACHPTSSQYPLHYHSKVPIKSFMNSITNPDSSNINYSKNNPQISPLHKQFNQLKHQFRQLVEINKNILERVETNQFDKTQKKQRKLRAKQMLKQILYRLEDIKFQIKMQTNQTKNANKKYQKILKPQAMQRAQKITQHNINNLSKQSNLIRQKRIEYRKQAQSKSAFAKNEKSNDLYQNKLVQSKFPQQSLNNQSNLLDNKIFLNQNNAGNQNQNYDKVQIQKLKKILNLEIQHRQIVEKKLQIISGKDLQGGNN